MARNLTRGNILSTGRQAMGMLFEYRNYIPTALRVLNVLKFAKPTQSPPVESTVIQNPFTTKEEKNDVIERARWLYKNVIVSDPQQLIASMPAAIGRLYQGEWAIYACSMTAVALCNIIRLYPECKEEFLSRVPEIIDIALTPAIRYYDTVTWGEDALATLDDDDSHMTYLSIIAWMMGNYRLAGGDDRYDSLHVKVCETLNRRMLQSPDLNLPSFPNGVVFLPDMMFAVLALRDYGLLHHHEFDQTVTAWLDKVKDWRTKQGILVSSYQGAKGSHSHKYNGRPSGAYSGLNCTGLALLNWPYAKDEYMKVKSLFVEYFKKYAALKEFYNRKPKLSFDVNAGPIVYGYSPTGTAFMMGAATYFGDWDFRQRLLNTAELAGNTIYKKGQRHYRLAEIMLTGEAITLAMRTMVNFDM